MSLEEDLHQLVLGMDGVATVYAADPLWLNVLKQVGVLLGPDDAGPVPFVVCSEGGGESTSGSLTVRVRIGTDGAHPAPVVARMVAQGIRAHIDAQHQGMLVKAVVEVAAIAL